MASNFTRKKIQSYSYGLNEVIGKGYSSQVFRGRHDDTGETVAVKVIDLRTLKNDINRVLLESEVQVLRELKGLPHVLALHQVFTTKNNTYIITELCQGDLAARLKGGLPPAKALAFMQQILTGYVGFARRQVIHRDLKPANVLVGEDDQLKVADFGFAIKAADASKYSKYNVGSPLYMAPESLKRNEYSFKTDIWALGVILHELLTGQTPWKAKNEKELVRKIESERAEDIISRLNVPAQAKEFMQRALRVEKAERMDVEDVASFDLTSTPIPRNILGEKKVNVGRALSIFSPQVEKQSSNTRDLKEFSQRRPSTLRSESANKSLQGKAIPKYNPSVTFELLRKDDSSTKENPQFMAPQIISRQQFKKEEKKQEVKKADRKLTSKILISQIHFCRFLYKLLGRINQSKRNGLLMAAGQDAEQVIMDYMGIIKHKIQNLISFKNKNYISAEGYEEYRQSSDCQKLLKIAKEYRQRYQTEMRAYWNSCRCSFTTGSTVALVSSLHQLLKSREGDSQFTATYQQDIIILDYLMTAKQLIDIFQNGQNYERFARKSRIEQIVEGRTAEISWQLYTKIVNRAQQVLQIKVKAIPRQIHSEKAVLVSV